MVLVVREMEWVFLAPRWKLTHHLSVPLRLDYVLLMGWYLLTDGGLDITKNLPSTDDSFTNLSSFDSFEEDILDKACSENVMDMESQSKGIPLATTDYPKINSISPSVSMLVDPHLVDMVEASGVIEENRGMYL
uniref:Uncharacterized protein n=1 Tax=Davidia involucrata TaxID=16924 RepID=A0A5B7BWG3_DAVIN